MALNSVAFDYFECNFSETNMKHKDKADGLSREGSSRVAIYRDTGIPNCYTIECSYHSCKRLNSLTSKFNKSKSQIEPENTITDAKSKIFEGKVN